eukprot:COSAG06_NODE_782_length_12363_cov_27.005463_7_plen_89_part_00
MTDDRQGEGIARAIAAEKTSWEQIAGAIESNLASGQFDFRRRVYNSDFVFDRWTPTPLQQKDGARRAGRLAPTCDPPTSRNERSSCRR